MREIKTFLKQYFNPLVESMLIYKDCVIFYVSLQQFPGFSLITAYFNLLSVTCFSCKQLVFQVGISIAK